MDDYEKEQDRERRILLGKHAQDVIKNPAFIRALEDMQSQLFAEFLSTDATESEERDKVWAVFQQSLYLKHQLDRYIDDGKTEDANKALDR